MDHKNEPGERGDAVLNYVRTQLGFEGHALVDESQVLGDWICRFHWPHDPEKSKPFAYQSFLKDGSAPSKAVDGSFENLKDRWKCNEDKSFSLWTYAEPMPEYGITEPTYSEGRHHALFNGTDMFALFNRDGSVIMVYERISTS